jgi:mRNA interferase RelE/StbE
MPLGYDLFLSKTAAKSARRLTSVQRAKLRSGLLQNERESLSFPYKKIRGEPHLYRIRIGNYRVLYKIDEPDKRIMVLKIERRSRAYK